MRCFISVERVSCRLHNGAVLVASSVGRSHGTSAPALRATSAIRGSSVETKMSHTSGMSFAASIGQTTKGLLPSWRRLFSCNPP